MKLTDKAAMSVIKQARRLSAVVYTAALLICCFGTANAQQGNQSDWNVPPPLAPGTITRGDRDGRTGNGGVAILTFTDVSAPAVPSSILSGLELAAINNTPPDADLPEQPASENVIAALPDVPLPDVPEMPAMPGRTITDATEPPPGIVPMPDAPEMPPVPSLPAASANGTTQAAGLPPMPGIPTQTGSFTPPPAGQIMWNAPGVLQNIDFKLN